MKEFYTLVTVILCVLLSACTNMPENVTKTDKYPNIFPDYIDVTIPVGIAPLNFNVIGKVDCVDVIVKGSKEGELHVNGGKLIVTVCAKIDGKWIGYKDFAIHVSNYDLDEWGLTYRRIAPGYEIHSQMGIYQRDLGSFDEYSIIDNSET